MIYLSTKWWCSRTVFQEYRFSLVLSSSCWGINACHLMEGGNSPKVPNFSSACKKKKNMFSWSRCFSHHLIFPYIFPCSVLISDPHVPRSSKVSTTVFPWDRDPGVVHLPLQLGGAEGPEHPGGAPEWDHSWLVVIHGWCWLVVDEHDLCSVFMCFW